MKPIVYLACISACLFMLAVTIGLCICKIQITNLEKQQLRIEQEYQRVITQNERLKRINNQNIQLLSQGGWDANEVIDVGPVD